MKAPRSLIELRKMISAANSKTGQIVPKIEIINESASGSLTCSSDTNETGA